MPDISEDLIYSYALSRIKGVGPITFKKFIQTFGSAKNVFDRALQDTSIKLAPSILSGLSQPLSFSRIQEEIDSFYKSGIKILTLQDELYPTLLTQIPDAPPFLYYQGSLESLTQEDWIGVVGSRRASTYGKKITRDFVKELVEAGLVIVSGFAAGIDIEAHMACLDSSGSTVAVLGGGLRKIYPSSNQKYVEKVCEKGVMISEFHPDEEPRPEFFPRRNRIIAGLSRGVLVVEAALKSGALITAQLALEYNRDVFAVPGSVFSETSAGCHSVIQQGAKLTTRAADILEEWRMVIPDVKRNRLNLTPDEEKILHVCQEQKATLDDLVKETGMPPDDLLVFLTKLEMEGALRSLGGGRYGAL